MLTPNVGLYRVDKGPNAARKRARDTIVAPLNNTNLSTYPLIPTGIPHRVR